MLLSSTRRREWHSVAIDEAHEMLIIKQVKMSVVKPSEDFISRIAAYIAYRTRTHANLKDALFPHHNKPPERVTSIYSLKPSDKIFEKKIQAQLQALEKVMFFF